VTKLDSCGVDVFSLALYLTVSLTTALFKIWIILNLHCRSGKVTCKVKSLHSILCTTVCIQHAFGFAKKYSNMLCAAFFFILRIAIALIGYEKN